LCSLWKGEIEFDNEEDMMEHECLHEEE